MMRILLLVAALLFGGPAFAQAPVALNCYTGVVGGGSSWTPCSASNPLAVSAAITPSGTQNVNLTQILSAAPSLTNPLWVTPATGATFTLGTGSAIVGRVGIDQTTPGTTNLVSAGQNGTWNIGTLTTLTGVTNTVNVAVIGNSFTNITTNADTNVKGSAGTLVGFSINTIGTTSSVQFFNDADGTCNSSLVGTFTTLVQGFVTVPATMGTGICVKTAGAVAADITVYWR